VSAETIRALIAGALLLHAFAHGRALAALIAHSLGRFTASWVPVRSGLFPGLARQAAARAASVVWMLSTTGFLGAGLLFLGVLAPGEAWRPLALGASIISTLGSASFSGIWPGSANPGRSTLNTLVALTMNLAILVTQLWLHWPPVAMFGK